MDNKGFTLLELMLCVLIISILIAIPTFNMDLFSRQKEKNELKEFIRDINYARNMAIMESTAYSVYIRFDKNSYTIEKYVGSAPKTIKKKEFTYGLQFQSTNIKGNKISFSRTGAPVYAGEVLLKNRKGEGIRVTITPVTGKVNIYYNE